MDGWLNCSESWYNNYAEGKSPAGRKAVATKKAPSVATMMKWLDTGRAKATDGCVTEPDGHCEHGKPSWMLVLGVI